MMTPTPENTAGAAPGPEPGGNDDHLSLPTTNNPHQHHQKNDRERAKAGLRIRDWVRSPRSGESRRPSHAGAGAGAESEAKQAPKTSSSRRHGGGNPAEPWWKIHLFRGMANDIRKRAPYYLSDWTDAWNYRVVPATVYMFFAK
jgi:hypothetical protein